MVCAKREMLANFFMNTTCGVCRNVGGSQSTDIALPVMNACMLIPKNVVSNVLITSVGFVNLVSHGLAVIRLSVVLPLIRVVFFIGPQCPRKHVRRVACQLYLTGLCPLGPDCPRGQ